MVRGRFALVVSTNPTAADIFKENEFEDDGEFVIGAERRVKRPSWPECSGMIVSIGRKSDLVKLKVNSAGQIDPNVLVPVKNRFQELAEKKKEEGLSMRDLHLQEVAQNLLINGPGQPVHAVSRLPKKRNVNDLEMLKEQLDNLDCWKAAEGKSPITRGGKVYVDGSVLLLLENLYRKKPTLLFAALLKHLVPDEVSCNPALSFTGAKGTVQIVQIPPAIVRAVHVKVADVCLKNKINVEFCVQNLVSNWLYHKQHPDRKKRNRLNEPPVVSNDHVAPAETLLETEWMIQGQQHALVGNNHIQQDEFEMFGPQGQQAQMVNNLQESSTSTGAGNPLVYERL